MYQNSAAFLDSFVQDEVRCRCLSDDTFGQPLANEDADVPIYDQYNRGLVVPEQGLERNPLNLEGMQRRPGLTGYIPSAEEGLEMGALPKPKTLMIALGEPDEDDKIASAKRRGLLR